MPVNGQREPGLGRQTANCARVIERGKRGTALPGERKTPALGQRHGQENPEQKRKKHSWPEGGLGSLVVEREPPDDDTSTTPNERHLVQGPFANSVALLGTILGACPELVHTHQDHA